MTALAMTPAPAVAAAPRCSIHPNASQASCERCGTFSCSSCLDLNNHCAACVARLVAELPPLSTRSLLAQLSMAGLGLSYALLAIHGFAFAGQEQSTASLVVQGLIGLMMLAFLPAGAIIFLIWFHAACRRTQAMGGNIQGSPAWAVGSFFVPFVNLVHPYSVARGILSVAQKPTGVIAIWQAGWIVSGVLSIGPALMKSPVMGLVGNIVAAISIAACVLFIRATGLLEAPVQQQQAAAAPAGFTAG